MKKKRFTVNCCGECPAIAQGIQGFYCTKIMKHVDNVKIIYQECPYIIYSLKTGRRLRDYSIRVYPYDHKRRDKCMKILKEKGYTQSKLAQELGVSQQYISKIFSGRNLSFKAETKIAQYFSMTRDEMFCHGAVFSELYPMRIIELLKSKNQNKEHVEEEIERLSCALPLSIQELLKSKNRNKELIEKEINNIITTKKA